MTKRQPTRWVGRKAANAAGRPMLRIGKQAAGRTEQKPEEEST
jgi:hypothetical protein